MSVVDSLQPVDDLIERMECAVTRGQRRTTAN